MTDAPGWGCKFLINCGIDPDDPADVRASYESCREAYARWLSCGEGEIDAECYFTLVDAVKDLYRWDVFPFDWPAPTLVFMPKPLRDLLPRTSDGTMP